MSISLLPRYFLEFFEMPPDRKVLATSNGKILLLLELIELSWVKSAGFSVFSYANIHGMEKHDRRVCLFGEKFIRFGEILENESTLFKSVGEECFLKDWVICCRFVSLELVVILQSHNTVKTVSFGTCQVTQKFQCEENCLLYSGLLSGSDSDDLMVISGTVFGQILIWKPDSESRIRHRLSGHRGVIFDVKRCPKTELLFSVSDDRSCKVWKDFVCLNTFYGHEARIWQCILNNDETFFTIGEDSRVNLWDIDRGSSVKSWQVARGSIRSACVVGKSLICGTDYGSIFSIYYRDNGENTTTKEVEQLKKYHLSTVCFTQKGLLVITNAGLVISLTEESMVEIYQSDSLKYSCLTKTMYFIFIGDLNGSLHVFSQSDARLVQHIKVSGSKIFSIVRICDNKICCSLQQGVLQVYTNSNETLQLNVMESLNFTLPHGKHAWATCALNFEEFWVFGDRNGSVCFFQQNANQQMHRKVHGEHGTTDLQVYDNENVTLSSIGRNGMCILWNLNRNMKTWSILSKTRVASGFEWPDRFLKLKKQSLGSFIAGFKGNKFTIYETQSRRFMIQLECGGGHRSFDLEESFSGQMNFVFCKVGRAYKAQIDLNSENEIVPHLHARHIKQIVKLGEATVATCSEDTSVALWQLDDKSICGLRLVQRLKSKLASVLCLAYCDNILVSGGGRSELCVFQSESALALKQFQLVAHRSNEYGDVIDIRYTSLQLFRRAENEPLRLAACRSDGFVHFYQIGVSDNNKVSLQVEPFTLYTETCLAKIKFVDPNFLVAIGTNGCLLVKNFNQLNAQIETSDFDAICKVEKCGLTALDAKTIDDYILCAVGSESGSISLVLILKKDKVKPIVKFTTCAAYHGSTVTDLKFDGNRIFATSCDQRVSVWSYDVDRELEKATINFECVRFINVADSTSFCIINAGTMRKLLVTGVGLQSLKIIDI